MATPTQEKFAIVSNSRAYLSAINRLGPIVNPISVNRAQLSKLVLSGADVSVYDNKSKKYVKVTPANLATFDKPVNDIPTGTPSTVNTGVGVRKPVKPAKTTEPVETPDPEESVESEEETPQSTETEVDTGVQSEEGSTPEVVEPVVETVVEETPEETPEVEATEVPTSGVVIPEEVTEFTFEYDPVTGLVDETNIDWAAMTKASRKACRAAITAYNATVTATATEE